MRPLSLPLVAILAALGLPAPAAADLRLQGEASMGLVHDTTPRTGDRDDGTPRLRFHQDFKIVITAERETESGLTFGASIAVEDPRAPSRRR